MSFPDHPTPYMPPMANNIGGFWSPPLMNHEQFDSSQFQHPPLKRHKPAENNMPPQGHKSTTHIFYKTRMCAKFLDGTCPNGEHCTFAHGPEDLRKPPPNWQELVQPKDRGDGNWNDEQRSARRMKICRKFYNGEECPYGDKCNFLHERAPVFKTENSWEREREISVISIGTTEPFAWNRTASDHFESSKHADNNLENAQVKTVFWKTRICSKWEKGQCPFGERCHFAHGQSDLQLPGAQVEAELVLNSNANPVKHFTTPVIVSYPAAALTSSPTKREKEDRKISKWKITKKINGIYGDWLDDLSPRWSQRHEDI